MREPGGIVAPGLRLAQSLQRGAMQRKPATGRDALLEGQPRELVTERDASWLRRQHAGSQALFEAVDVAFGQDLEQPRLDPARRDRYDLEQPARVRAEARRARQHRLAHGGRDPLLAGGERLGHEERVATGRTVELAGVDRVGSGEHRNCLGRERLEPEALHRWARGEISERDLKRVPAVELVVAVGRDHESWDGRDPAAQQAQHVERRRVGPVEILEHEERGHAPDELVADRGGDLMRPHATAGDELVELAAHGLGDLEQGAERSRREQGVAPAPEHPGTRVVLVAELPHEGGLADARLAADEDEPAAAGGTDRREDLVQRGELRRALEQLVLGRPGGRSALAHDWPRRGPSSHATTSSRPKAAANRSCSRAAAQRDTDASPAVSRRSSTRPSSTWAWAARTSWSRGRSRSSARRSSVEMRARSSSSPFSISEPNGPRLGEPLRW